MEMIMSLARKYKETDILNQDDNHKAFSMNDQ